MVAIRVYGDECWPICSAIKPLTTFKHAGGTYISDGVFCFKEEHINLEDFPTTPTKNKSKVTPLLDNAFQATRALVFSIPIGSPQQALRLLWLDDIPSLWAKPDYVNDNNNPLYVFADDGELVGLIMPLLTQSVLKNLDNNLHEILKLQEFKARTGGQPYDPES